MAESHGKEIKERACLSSSCCMPDLPTMSAYPQTCLKVGTLHHRTDGAAEAHGSEGSCPGCPPSLWCLDHQIRQAPELLWFPKLSPEKTDPRQPQSLRVAKGLQEKAVGGEREKLSLQSGLWVSELNDPCGLERGTDEVRSLET